MRGFTKSILGYTWSTSLFGFQQMVNLITPQGWQQTDRAAQSFEWITKASAEEMGGLVKSTFKVGNDLQRRGVDLAFGLFTLGMFDDGKDRADQPRGAATGSATNMGEQAGDVITQSFQAVGQSAGVIGQALSGIFCGSGCGGSAQPTGWGPVPPPAGDGD